MNEPIPQALFVIAKPNPKIEHSHAQAAFDSPFNPFYAVDLDTI
jgi:hypothetical protein